MSLANYTDLLNAVQAWLDRPDLAGVIPDFVRLAEIRVQRDLELPFVETTATGTMSGDTLALPVDFRFARHFRLDMAPVQVLSLAPPEEIARLKSLGGRPCAYMVSGLNAVVAPDVPTGTAYTLIYHAGLPALAADGDGVNWLITNAPDLLLYGALLESAPYIANDERIPVWSSMYRDAVKTMKLQAWRARFAGGPVAMRPDRWA